MTQEEIDRYEQIVYDEGAEDANEEDINCIQRGELVLKSSPGIAKQMARDDIADEDTMPVLLEYIIPDHNLYQRLQNVGMRPGEVIIESGTEWFVKGIKNNSSKHKKMKDNFVIIQLEIYTKEEFKDE